MCKQIVLPCWFLEEVGLDDVFREALFCHFQKMFILFPPNLPEISVITLASAAIDLDAKVAS